LIADAQKELQQISSQKQFPTGNIFFLIKLHVDLVQTVCSNSSSLPLHISSTVRDDVDPESNVKAKKVLFFSFHINLLSI